MFKLRFLICLIIGIISPLNVSYSNSISIENQYNIYDNYKYKFGFKNFEFANPNAPKKGSVKRPAYGKFDNFNPFILKGAAPSTIVARTFDSLGYIPIDDQSTIYPLIAEKFERSEDNNFIGFYINPKAKFSNGEKITAEDVVFSFNILIEKGTPFFKSYYADILKVEKITPSHVRFYFKPKSKNKELPILASQISIMSKKFWEGKDFAKPIKTPILGSGAYTIKEFEQNRFIILERNKNYWAKDLPSQKGMNNFDKIRFDYYNDTTVTLQALFSGNLDVREEMIAKQWARGYQNNLIKDKKIIKVNIPHNNPANIQGFYFNTRLDKFKDRNVRKAISSIFNFDWANKHLFYNQYKRLNSFYSNTQFAATGLPKGKELEILKSYGNKIDENILSTPMGYKKIKNYLDERENLRNAVKLLNKAGWDFVNGKMTNLKTGEKLSLTVTGNTANGNTFVRVLLPFINNLKKIGIDAKFRTVEVNIFKNNLDNFDFEMAIIGLPQSKLPATEQKEFWGSEAGKRKAGYNFAGIDNPVIDDLIEKIISTKNKENYKSYIKALDRVLFYNHYIILHWYGESDRIAYWDKYDYPKTNIKTGFAPSLWWEK